MCWQDDKAVITETYISAINENNVKLFGLLKENIDDVQKVLPLIEFIIARLTNVTNLTIQGELWDAEIILRSALETFVKLQFIIFAPPIERDVRLREFWEDLAEINQLKQFIQAQKNLNHLGDSEIHKLAYSPVILSDEKEKELRDKWPKRKRRKLEQKWSFTEIVNSLGKFMGKEESNLFEVFLHSYRISSHISHGDETGILMIKERSERKDEERKVVNAAHYIRLLSDSYIFCFWSAISVSDFLNLSKNQKHFVDTFERVKDLEKLTQKYQAEVFQDPDYDAYR